MGQRWPRASVCSVLERARELLEPIGSYRQIARAYGNASYAAILEDRPTEALELLAVAMSAADKLSDIGIPAYLCGNLGLAHLFTGAPDAGAGGIHPRAGRGRPAISWFRYRGGTGRTRRRRRRKRIRPASRHAVGCSKGARQLAGVDRPILDRLEHSYFAPARSRLGATAWHHAEQTGAEMSDAEAMQYATGRPTDADRPAADRTVLDSTTIGT